MIVNSVHSRTGEHALRVYALLMIRRSLQAQTRGPILP
jgi:hypothetical protein